MVKIIKNVFFIIFVFTSSLSVADNLTDKIYDADYYEDEGRLLFKVRAFAIKSSPEQKSLPAPLSSNPIKVGNFVENGFGGDTASTIFFSDRIAAELSLGLNLLNTKSSTLQSIANNYNGSIKTKKKRIYSIPLTITGQYHIAPFGAIRPYVGAGYHAAYIFTKAKEFKINNGHGPVVQIGIDFVAKDDTLITLDLRQYLLKTKITYKGAIVNTANVSSKVALNPLVLSLGVGFMF